MLQSFYKYIIKELLLGYFKNNLISKGSRYYFIVENNEHREGLIEAIKEYAEPITISGIYQGNNSSVNEESYNTYVLDPGNGHTKIIIGFDTNSTEDYLTTIRNSVGVSGSKYEGYGVLYILSNSILSSIITACQDLQGVGYPLNAHFIIKDIQNKMNDVITKDFEVLYFKKHLEKISEYIDDGICNLFDFKSALNVLSEKHLSGHYNDLDFFSDKLVYDAKYVSDKEMKDRVEKNHFYYRRIYDIMNVDDDSDKLSLLQKFLDEKLSKHIVNITKKITDAWKQIDLQDILDSINRKNTTLDLEVDNVYLESEGIFADIVKSEPRGNKKRSIRSVIVCDTLDDEEDNVVVEFNKDIKNDKSTTDCEIKGSVIKFKVKDEIITKKIGINDNTHDFYITKIKCKKSFFKGIEKNFSLNKKGDVTVVVPEEVDFLTFGDGDEEVKLPFDNKIEWSDNYKLTIPVSTDDDNDTINFFVNFNGKEVKFVLKLYVAEALPPVGPVFPPEGEVKSGIPNGETPFSKIKDGDTERSIFGYWRKYLEWEKLFVDNEASYISISRNELTGEPVADIQALELPDKVKWALQDIYMYYKDVNSVPSLCPLNEPLRKLLTVYCNSVIEVINNIPTDRSLIKQEYNLTKLGVVSYEGKIYFSPFHPLIASYILEYDKQYEKTENSSFALRLLTPFYLIPYLYFNSKPMRPYTDSELSKIHNWLCYEDVNSKPQERANDITSKMVESKMYAFIQHFNYLFPDKNCPIIISTIGISDDTNVIKGIVEFIKKQYKKGVQKIEIHEYVDNLMDESFFERLNRLDSLDSITRELESINLNIESKGEYTSQEIIHQLFTRISFYKHKLSPDNKCIDYSHIAFYQMNTGTNFCEPMTRESRVEMSMNGLISIPSTINKADAYVIGFGTKGLSKCPGNIYPMTIALNTLYSNERYEGSSAFRKDSCVAKRYKFGDSSLLNSIYENANWVTFINPEVDINFFYKQDVYIVHYTDQYTINAKYDSITVTKHIDQYENMLRKSYESYLSSEEKFVHFNKTMMNYFNCLNGSWMLSIVNKTESQILEKMSIVAASIAMLKFMSRVNNVIWIPVSLEEILRVTGSIGLPQEYIFSKKTLGAKGVMSDDLLMIGLDCNDENNLRLYYYPVEVKLSETSSMAEKAGKQVSQTYTQLKEHLFGEGNFVKNIYRTFFASQFLTNAEKLNANCLLSNVVYDKIEENRFKLLNLDYEIKECVPVKEMGCAATVLFFKSTNNSLTTSVIENVPVCEIHFSYSECFQFVAEPEDNHLEFLVNSFIKVDDTVNLLTNNTSVINDEDKEDDVIEISDLQEDNSENTDNKPKSDINEETNLYIQQKETDSLCAADPLGHKDSIKIIVGHTPQNKREIVFEPNNTHLVSHPNMGIIGTMGTGKTQFARSLIAQFSKESAHNVGGNPIGILVFDYKGDYKDKEFLEIVNGEAYKYNFPFNPLKLIIHEDDEGINLPAITADSISDSFAKAYGLGLKQQSTIKQIIIDTYEDAGITKDPSTWSYPAPTMEDVIKKFFDSNDSNDKVYALFDKLRDYTIFTSDNSCCVSLFEWLNKVRVIDLTMYPDDTKKVIVSLILDLFYAEMRQLGGSKQENGFRELRAMIMVDEAHQFMKKDFMSLRHIISEGRMFGVGMILSTQNIDDFKTQNEDYSQYILSWVIHHVNSMSKSEIQSIVGANDPSTDKYINFINNAKIFESICKIGSKIEGIKDLPFFRLVKEDNRFLNEED